MLKVIVSPPAIVASPLTYLFTVPAKIFLSETAAVTSVNATKSAASEKSEAVAC